MKTENLTKKEVTEKVDCALNDFFKYDDGCDIDEYLFNEIFVEYLSVYFEDISVCYAISGYIKTIFYGDDDEFGSDYDYSALTEISNDIINEK